MFRGEILLVREDVGKRSFYSAKKINCILERWNKSTTFTRTKDGPVWVFSTLHWLLAQISTVHCIPRLCTVHCTSLSPLRVTHHTHTIDFHSEKIGPGGSKQTGKAYEWVRLLPESQALCSWRKGSNIILFCLVVFFLLQQLYFRRDYTSYQHTIGFLVE